MHPVRARCTLVDMDIGGYTLSVPNLLILVIGLLVVLLILRTLKNIVVFLLLLAAVLVVSYLIVGDLNFLLDFFVQAKKELPRRLR